MRLLVVEDFAFLASRLFRYGPLPFVWGPIGRALGELDLRVRRERHRREEKNLLLFRPELGRSEARSFVRALVMTKWRASGFRAKFNQAGGGPAANDVAEGLEHLHGALALGKGVILWESPFGSRPGLQETLFGHGIPFVQVHGAEHGGSMSWVGQNIIKPMVRRAEGRFASEIVDIQEGTYAYLRLIKERLAGNGVVCMPGLGPKGRQFIRLSFLGQPECFATGVVSLAISTGAALMPAYCMREPSGGRRTVFEQPLELDRGGDRKLAQAEALKEYARLLEGYVRQYPDQWHRWHANPVAAEDARLSAVARDAPDKTGSAVS